VIYGAEVIFNKWTMYSSSLVKDDILIDTKVDEAQFELKVSWIA